MRRGVRRAVPLIAAAMFIAACSSSSAPNGGSAGSSRGATSAKAAAVVAQAKAVVAKAMQPLVVPPLTPVKVVPGKTIGYMVGGLESPLLVFWAQAAEQAIKAAGYKYIACNGQLSPQGWSACDEQFINDHVNAIINQIGADAVIGSAVKQARLAGIPVLCEFCYNAGSPVKDAAKYGSVANADANWYQLGVQLGDWMIVQADGKPRVALMEQPLSLNVAQMAKGIIDTLVKCKSLGCSTTTQVLQSGTDNGASEARVLATNWLQQYPKGALDFIYTPSDNQATFVQQVLATSGRTDVTVVSAGCAAPSIAWIEKGGVYQKVDDLAPGVWTSWAIVDQAIRVLAGQKGQNVIVPTQLITAANAPKLTSSPEPCEQSADYAKAYEAAWIK
jgi:ABC-type sugar transport system substrate-binding protein